MALKFTELKIKKRGKQHKIAAKWVSTEVGANGTWTPTWTKESNQFLSADLNNCIERCIPHIMFGGEYISEEISLDGKLDYAKWFNKHEYQDDERFTGVEVTKIQFIGNEALDSVKIWGHKITQRTEKPFKTPLETPVLSLMRGGDHQYPLVTLLDEHMNNLLLALDDWLERGITLNKAQQQSLFEQVEAEAE